MPTPSATKPLDVLVLAAGLGTRMTSNVAKVLHKLDGRPLIAHVCETAAKLAPRKIYVVVGHQANEVETAVAQQVGENTAVFVVQAQQRGTGDAVMAAAPHLANSDSHLLILSGDVPLVKADTLRRLIVAHASAETTGTILTVRLENPSGYGRVIRGESDNFERIVEQKDATEEERQIREINSGIYCFESTKLFSALERVRPENSQGEYYLTDAPKILKADGDHISLYHHSDAREVSGINTRAELAEFENLVRRRTIRRLMIEDGVTFIDPSNAYVSSQARIGRDSIIHANVHIE